MNNGGFLLTESEYKTLLKRHKMQQIAVSKSMGYDGSKSPIRHVADDLPADYKPPIPISTRTGI